MITRRTLLAAALQPRQRPNIYLALADNWAYPHAGAYGDPVVKTPAFDRVAAEGVLFTNAFAPTPSCSPSRASLLTGQESHRLAEAASLYGNLSGTVATYTELLEQNGYFVGYSDKGWGPGRAEGKRENPAGRAFKSFEEFLAAKPAGTPFCFWFGSHDPHVPWNRGQQGKAHLDARKVQVPPHLPDTAAVRDDILNYCCEVQAFDEELGAHLKQLEAHHQLDNTLVAVTSDNGWQMPRGLANCYDLGVRIPMAVRYPARFAKASKRTDFVALTDLAPTFLEAAGVKTPPSMTATSLFSGTRRNEIFLERERHANVRRGDLSYPVRGIRTSEFLYLRNFEPDRWPAGDPEFYWAVGPYGDIDDSPTKQMLMREKPEPYFSLNMGKRPAEELYDLRKDPGQIHNLAKDRAYEAKRAELAARVAKWMTSTGDPRAKTPRTDFWDRAPYSGARFKGAPPKN